MPKILACPHCKARMVVAHDHCRRCHRPIGGQHIDVGGASSAKPDAHAPSRRPLRTAALVGSCVAILAAVGAVAWPRASLPDPTTRADAVGGSQSAPGAASGAGDAGLANREPSPVAPVEAAVPAAPGDGYSKYAAGDTAGALAHYLAAVERRPDDAAALNNVGQLLVELGRAGEAVSYLERAAAASPTSATMRFNLAAACGMAGQWDRAITAYRGAADLDPRDARIAHNLGLALKNAGRDAEAAEAFRTATGLAPDQSASLMGLAQALERLGKPTEAADAYERLAAAQPESPDAAAFRRRAEQLRARRPGASPASGEAR